MTSERDQLAEEKAALQAEVGGLKQELAEANEKAQAQV